MVWKETIYRLSKSEYKEHFILKGGIFLYALYDGSYARATTDIDFLSQRISIDTEKIKQVFAEIFSVEADDPLRFDIETLSVKPIAEMKKYHGVNVSIIAYLDRTSINVSKNSISKTRGICMRFDSCICLYFCNYFH